MTKLITLLVAGSLAFATAYSAANEIPSGQELQFKAEQNTRTIDTASLKKQLDDEPDLLLIDIRTKDEIQRMGGAIDVPQNINIPRGWLEFRVQSAAATKDTPIVVYCGGGLRSPMAAETLQQMGYTNVSNYAEGYLGWIKSASQ